MHNSIVSIISNYIEDNRNKIFEISILSKFESVEKCAIESNQ